LKEDGLWSSSASRWRLLKLLGRVVGNIAPKWLRILRPGYHPSQIEDPKWGLAWAKLFDVNAGDVARLDTHRLDALEPVSAIGA
jgi:hypothetical protein